MPITRRTTSRKKREQRRSDCPIACTLDIVGDKWTLLIIRDLLNGKKRYGEFLESPEGVPTNILAERLKRLEAHGIVEKQFYSRRPPRAEYHITAKGSDLALTVEQLSAWGTAWCENTEPLPAHEPAAVREATPAAGEDRADGRSAEITAHVLPAVAAPPAAEIAAEQLSPAYGTSEIPVDGDAPREVREDVVPDREPEETMAVSGNGSASHEPAYDLQEYESLDEHGAPSEVPEKDAVESGVRPGQKPDDDVQLNLW